MVFSSNIFLFFFLPIFLIAYFVTPQKFRNYTLLLFSIVFYAYGAPDFVFLLVGECVGGNGRGKGVGHIDPRRDTAGGEGAALGSDVGFVGHTGLTQVDMGVDNPGHENRPMGID